MKPILGRHIPPLLTTVDRDFFQDIVQLVEAQQMYESNIQAQVDKLSASYYYISCDIESV